MLRELQIIFVSILLSCAGVSALGQSQPNSLFIVAGDWGYGDVHCLNPDKGKIATPWMDKLAVQGMVFTDAHSSASVCTPTRYGLLTGRYNWRSGLQSGVLRGFDEALIAPDRLTVAGLLKERRMKRP